MAIKVYTSSEVVLKKDASLGDFILIEETNAKDCVAVMAKPEDVPLRYDLAKDHPLYGKRTLKVVPAGYPDCTIDEEGNLVPTVPALPIKIEEAIDELREDIG